MTLPIFPHRQLSPDIPSAARHLANLSCQSQRLGKLSNAKLNPHPNYLRLRFYLLAGFPQFTSLLQSERK
jgi:hypothetical protein